MKKLFTSLFVVLVSGAVSAGTPVQLSPTTSAQHKKMNFAPGTVLPNHGQSKASSRAQTTDLFLDYGSIDEFNVTTKGGTWSYTPNYVDLLNSRFDTSVALGLRMAGVSFDTLAFLNSSTGPVSIIPKAKVKQRVDSVYVVYSFSDTVVGVGNDSLTIKLIKNPITLSSPNTIYEDVSNPEIWSKVYTGADLRALVTDPNALSIITVAPGVQLNQGESFSAMVVYSGDTSNKFYISYGVADSCADPNMLLARSSVSSNNFNRIVNSFYKFTLGANSGVDIGTLSIASMPANCRYWVWQNFNIWAQVSAEVQPGIVAYASSTSNCPNATVSINAEAFGAEGYAYKWTTTGGTLASATDSATTITLPATNGPVTLTVTAISNTNDTVIATKVLTVNGVTVTTTGSPFTLACTAGSTVTIPTSLSGFTAGTKTYAWSNGITTASNTVSTIGNYTVTVTNSVGCTATATAVVTFPGNITNTADFSVAYPNGKTYFCTGIDQTITNTSAKTSGWNSSWDYDAGTLTSSTTNAVFNFSTPKTAALILTMDSAGCTFSKTKNIQVKVCTGVEDVDFTQNILIYPNPTSGNVNFEIPTVEKSLTIKVYNILGAEVKSIKEEASGIFSKLYNFSELNSGTYIVKISNAGKTATKRLTID